MLASIYFFFAFAHLLLYFGLAGFPGRRGAAAGALFEDDFPAARAGGLPLHRSGP